MPVSIPYDARMLRSRAAMRTALIRLLETETLDDIAVRSIAREAGVGSATFYRHYETKTELLEDIATEEMDALINASITALRTKGTRDAALALCRYIDDHKALWRTLFNGG